jgi:small subunit ribosomal protein S3
MDKKNIADLLIEDKKVREFLKKKLYAAGISKIEIERTVNKLIVNLFTAKPGVLIGKGGQGIEKIKADVEGLTGKSVSVNVVEVKKPDVDAQLIAENIAAQLEKRISFRRAMKQAISRTMKAGAKGIKTKVSGRLGGAEIARAEGYHEGSIPLQTLRADIDYGFAEAHTTYGCIGVKVWVYKGEVLSKPKKIATEGVR